MTNTDYSSKKIAYADCLVCHSVKDQYDSVEFFKSNRFHKKKDTLEDHIRSHLEYRSFYCHICLQDSTSESKRLRNRDEYIYETFGSSKDFLSKSKVFKLEREAKKKFKGKTFSMKTIIRHIRKDHFGQQVKAANNDPNIFHLRHFVGQHTIEKLEDLLKSSLQEHVAKYETILKIRKKSKKCNKVWYEKTKKTKPKESIKEIPMQSKMPKKNRSVEEKDVKAINFTQNSSYFNIYPRQDEAVTKMSCNSLGISLVKTRDDTSQES